MTCRRHNLQGQTFGKWKVLTFSHINQSRSAQWICECSCGKQSIVSALNLRKGNSTQCRICASKNKTSIYQQGDKLRQLYIFKLNQYYKIGVTNNWEKRLDNISRMTPYKISKVLVVDNYQGLEKKLHTKYKDYCVHGEWFNLSEEQVNQLYTELVIFPSQELACTGSSCEII